MNSEGRRRSPGSWIQFLAVIVAVIAGVVATVQNYRNRTLV